MTVLSLEFFACDDMDLDDAVETISAIVSIGERRARRTTGTSLAPIRHRRGSRRRLRVRRPQAQA